VPSNVRFDCCNVIEGTNFPDNMFDVVHIRVMLLAVRSVGMLLRELKADALADAGLSIPPSRGGSDPPPWGITSLC
jgi:hypothetical protein